MPLPLNESIMWLTSHAIRQTLTISDTRRESPWRRILLHPHPKNKQHSFILTPPYISPATYEPILIKTILLPLHESLETQYTRAYAHSTQELGNLVHERSRDFYPARACTYLARTCSFRKSLHLLRELVFITSKVCDSKAMRWED